MEKCLFELKFGSKQLLRESKKCEKEEKVQKAKLKKAITQNNMEGAKIYAENAIRQKNQALNFLRMSARIDAVQSRVQTAISMKNVSKNMGSVTKNMEATMRRMNLTEISKMLEKFEKQFENLDIQSSYMENAMNNTTQQFIPQDDVKTLMAKTADEAGIELNMNMPGMASTSLGQSAVTSEQDELSQRLAKLRET